MVSLAETVMLDLAYLVGTVLFFGLMLAYVGACAALGRRNSIDGGRES